MDATYAVLSKDEIIALLADKITAEYERKNNDKTMLNYLTSKLVKTEKAIQNILSAMEQGVFTNSMKERLEQLENRKTELNEKIASEQTKTKLHISESDIKTYISEALKKEPRLMVDTLIKKVILYNDKIEIYYNYTNRANPDATDDHRDFIFYTCKKSFSLDRWTFEKQPIVLDLDITLSA